MLPDFQTGQDVAISATQGHWKDHQVYQRSGFCQEWDFSTCCSGWQAIHKITILNLKIKGIQQTLHEDMIW